MMNRLAPLVLALLAFPSWGAEPVRLEFDPRVGNTGIRVTVKTPVPRGATLKFGNRNVSIIRDDGTSSFIVPEGSSSSFIEVVEQGKVIARSAVPFVVAGASFGGPQKLIGLKEAIDVFGYVDPMPEGNVVPEQKPRPIFKLDDQDILTLGEPPIQRLAPAVELGDAASAAKQGMGYGFVITARPPKPKRPTPTPVPEN